MSAHTATQVRDLSLAVEDAGEALREHAASCRERGCKVHEEMSAQVNRLMQELAMARANHEDEL